MGEDDAAPEHTANWLAAVLEGGLPQLALGKHVSTALGRLISGVTDLPAAGLENLAQRIRDDTKSRSKVVGSLAQAAATYTAGREDIVQRAAERWVGQAARKQENVERVAGKVIEHLRDEPAPEGVDAGPSDDFMNRFASLAEDASSEDLQDLFARVLAGELRCPGAISLATLQFVSVMDQPLAAVIQEARAWIPRNFAIPKTSNFNGGRKFEVINTLVDYSLARPGAIARRLNFDESGIFPLLYNKKAIIVYGPPNTSAQYEILPITRVGREVMSLLPLHDDETEIASAAAFLRRVSHVTKVTIGSVEFLPDGGAFVTDEIIV